MKVYLVKRDAANGPRYLADGDAIDGDFQAFWFRPGQGTAFRFPSRAIASAFACAYGGRVVSVNSSKPARSRAGRVAA